MGITMTIKTRREQRRKRRAVRRITNSLNDLGLLKPPFMSTDLIDALHEIVCTDPECPPRRRTNLLAKLEELGAPTAPRFVVADAPIEVLATLVSEIERARCYSMPVVFDEVDREACSDDTPGPRGESGTTTPPSPAAPENASDEGRLGMGAEHDAEFPAPPRSITVERPVAGTTHEIPVPEPERSTTIPDDTFERAFDDLLEPARGPQFEFGRSSAGFPPDGPVDDGAEPDQDEVDAVLRAGVSDSSEVVGHPVLYETDRRGGKRYPLPARITVARSSHPDMPLLRAAEEARSIIDRLDIKPDGFGGRLELEKLTERGHVVRTKHGFHVHGNPVPIPLDGTVHLKVDTPGPAGSYDEWSVPYDARQMSRTWRFLKAPDVVTDTPIPF